jgi:MinD-like ATPase involved in chromosome partitioning or flagellar assembly
MAEKETIEKVKDKQGILDKIQNVFTFGYSTKEDLRELDKKLRDFYYADFKSMRHKWEELYLAALNASKATDDFKKVIQVMDRVAEKVNRADYGYAGLMDRKGHIRETELARVFNYDKDVSADIQSIVSAVEDLYNDSQAEKWSEAAAKARNIKSLILGFESKWDGREKQFRPMEV